MGSMKELLFEMQEERRDEWIAENYPDAEEGTPEWDAAAQEYSWFQDWMEEAAEQQYFEASLASIPDRLQDAKAELDELESLMQFNQPGIVERMAYVHCVSVLDSFLMYSARALLSHPRIYRSSCTRLIRWFLIRKTEENYLLPNGSSRSRIKTLLRRFIPASSVSCSEEDISEPQSDRSVFFKDADNAT